MIRNVTSCPDGRPAFIYNFLGGYIIVEPIEYRRDKKLCAAFISLFLALGVWHFVIFVSHVRHRHVGWKMIKALFVTMFCFIRVIPFALRLHWPVERPAHRESKDDYTAEKNSRFYFAHEILINLSVVLPALAGLLLSHSIVQSRNPAWCSRNKIWYICLFCLYVAATLAAMVLFIAGIVLPFRGRKGDLTHDQGQLAQRAAVTWFTIAVARPFLIAAADASALPEHIDGTFRPEFTGVEAQNLKRDIITILISATFLTAAVGYRAAVLYMNNACFSETQHRWHPWFLGQFFFYATIVLEVLSITCMSVAESGAMLSREQVVEHEQVHKDKRKRTHEYLEGGSLELETPPWARRLEYIRSLERVRSDGY